MIVPVILSGGAGSRLWPKSRSAFPKPFLALDGSQSLLAKTLLRAAPLAEAGRIVIVTHKDYYFQTRECVESALADHSLKVEYLLEPSARNTAAAIGLAALHLQATQAGDCAMLVLPADHLIDQQERFAAAVTLAAQGAKKGKLVTFGVVPDRPETGYGYIKADVSSGCISDKLYSVSSFVEKPDLQTAQKFLQEGSYFWNAGMFCFCPNQLVEQLAQCAPAIETAVRQVYFAANRSIEPFIFAAQAYAEIESDSIDYAVMQKSTAVAVIPADFDWNDIGAWDAVASCFSKDENGNSAAGEVLWIDSKDSFVSANGRLVAMVGCEGLSVIDSDDALLVVRNGAEQQVKQVVEQLIAANDSRAHLHLTVNRPWGSYSTLAELPFCKIKVIRVKPGATLSLQSHKRRSEHWIVVAGKARVTCDDKVFDLAVNKSTWIPQEAKHRLANLGQDELVLIEVQWGSYFGEDDIVRYEDAYGRVE